MLKNQRGQGLIEYLIIVALMAVAAISIMGTLGATMNRRFANIAHVLQGDKERVEKSNISKTQYEKKDLGTFLKSSVVKDSGSNDE